jgi:hypothetical protein
MYLTIIQRFIRGFGPISERESNQLGRCIRRIISDIEIERRRSSLISQMNLVLNLTDCPPIDVSDVFSLPMSYHQFVHMNANYANYRGDDTDLPMLSRRILREVYTMEKANVIVKRFTGSLNQVLRLPEDDFDAMMEEIMENISEIVQAEIGESSGSDFIEISDSVIFQVVDQVSNQYTFGYSNSFQTSWFAKRMGKQQAPSSKNDSTSSSDYVVRISFPKWRQLLQTVTKIFWSFIRRISIRAIPCALHILTLA